MFNEELQESERDMKNAIDGLRNTVKNPQTDQVFTLYKKFMISFNPEKTESYVRFS